MLLLHGVCTSFCIYWIARKCINSLSYPSFTRYIHYIRHQTERYASALSKHEERFKNNMDKVVKWKHALNIAANLYGLDSHSFRDESELIKAVVKTIVTKLIGECSAVLKGLVGIENRIQQIESMLCVGAEDVHVRIGAIWGMAVWVVLARPPLLMLYITDSHLILKLHVFLQMCGKNQRNVD